jgi:uncharacterized phage protein (TIGR02216 family)
VPPDEAAWRALLKLGLGRLRLSPADFWAMTPIELVAALEGAAGGPGKAAPPAAAELAALRARFPDQ